MNESEQIEKYINQELPPGDKLLMDAKCLIDPDLKEHVFFQKQTYLMVQHYGRKQLQAEIRSIDEQLFTDNFFVNFRNKIFSIFK
jgi:hypothetical protein